MKKYQVFISSTYIDLIEERHLVMTTLLNLNCIPAGMEIFPASNDSQFDYIKKIIDESDYYLLIIGNRYGSKTVKGISFTEMEYDYAVSINKPIISFLAKSTGNDKVNNTGDSKKFELFKQKVLQKLVRFYSNKDELSIQVTQTLSHLIRLHEEEDDRLSPKKNSFKELEDEFYKLNKKIDDLIFLQKQNEETQHPVNEKVRIFIGSSIEGLEIARCIQSELAYDYIVEVWNQGTIFGLGNSTLEALEQAVKTYDIGIFIFTPDDTLISREINKQVARDNVIFELGLFIGKLTRFRAFVVHPFGKSISIPSDLAGITTATYDPSHPNLGASLGPACHAIRNAIRRIQ